MAPKSSSKKKKSASPAAPVKTAQTSIDELTARHERITETLLATTPLRRDFVHLTLHLLDCPYVVNDWVVSISTQLSSIIDRLEREHGCMRPVRLYRLPACEENEITDRTLSLQDLGCVPGPLVDSPESPAVRYDIIYDFLPSAENPILMREPDLSRVHLDVRNRKTEAEEKIEAEFEQRQDEAIQMLPYVGIHMVDSSFHGNRFRTDSGSLLKDDQSLFNTPIAAAKEFASQFA